MLETSKDKDREKSDEILRRLLKTPPEPGRKARVSEGDQKQKLGGRPTRKTARKSLSRSRRFFMVSTTAVALRRLARHNRKSGESNRKTNYNDG
jgi:hypothetical protein